MTRHLTQKRFHSVVDDCLFAPVARLFDEEKELAALAKEDIGENDGYLSTYMQGGAYVLSKASHAQCYTPCLQMAQRACQSQLQVDV